MNQPRNGSNDRLIGQVIADRYQILAMLGEGGMGRVYLAEHVRMGRKSAVKVMSPNTALSADAVSRFNREAANASRINHPNVAQIYDFGETDDGMLYLAMEYVEGETLRRHIERVGPVALLRAAELTRQIGDALGAAHHLGIVHRDLKPDNILLTRLHDGAECVKVVDFGIAKAVQGSGGEAPGGGSQTVTTAGVSLGTPEYMSPEQLAGERLDSRTDLYSLGVVLFNMLTGSLPHPRVTSKETLVRRLTAKPRTLAEVVPEGRWPAGLQAALDRALAPEPIDRYASVAELAREVMSVANGSETVPMRSAVPRPTPGPTQIIDGIPVRKPTRKLRDKTAKRPAMIAASALLVIAAGGVGAIVAIRSRRVDAAPPSVAVPQRDSTPPAPAIDTGGHPEQREGSAVLVASKSRPKPDSSKHVAVTSPATVTAVDTTPAPTAVSGRGRRGLRDAQEIRVLGEQAQEHFKRAADFVRNGEVGKARTEFVQAAPVVGLLRKLSVGTPTAAQVEQALRASSLQTVQACRAGLADSVTHPRFPPNFRCEQLLPPAVRGQRGQRANPSRLDR